MEDIFIGTTDRTIPIFIPDPASTTGAGKTGLAAAAITVTYTRYETDNDVVHTDVTSSLSDLSALTDAHADWGWKEVSSTLAKGQYRLDVADAVFATGAWYAVVQVTITSGTAAATPKAFRLIARNDLTDVAQTGDSYAIVNSGTHGNAALKAILDTSGVVLANGAIAAAKIADGALTAAKFAAGAFDAVWTVAERLLTAGTNIVLAKGTGVTGFTDIDAAGVRTAVGLSGATLDAQLGDLPTNAELAAAVPTAVQNREEMDSNSTRLASIDGKTTNLPSDPADQSLVIAAADAISGAIAALNNLSAAQVRTELAVELARLDAAVSTRLASAGYTAPPTAVENADAYLKRDMSAVTGEASRSPLNALRFSRNKFTVIDDVLTVYKEDDTTIAWTAVITKTAGDPVSASDPT